MERMQLHGELELQFFLHGKLTHCEKRNNLIVDSGYKALFAGLGGAASKNIIKIQAGTNGDAVDLVISRFTSTANSLTIQFTLGANDANDLTIAEFGTICADGTLFSRKNWTPFLKIADLSVEGTWTISRI
jgi:hypothetical protein